MHRIHTVIYTKLLFSLALHCYSPPGYDLKKRKMLYEILLVAFITFCFISRSLKTFFYLLILSVRISDWKESRCG